MLQGDKGDPGPQGPQFQWAPTLGGECYQPRTRPKAKTPNCFNGHPPLGVNATTGTPRCSAKASIAAFQWAPTLGGECYTPRIRTRWVRPQRSFNGHPPLGVNATPVAEVRVWTDRDNRFQWAPTLGGECYLVAITQGGSTRRRAGVSMGTHPWG